MNLEKLFAMAYLGVDSEAECDELMVTRKLERDASEARLHAWDTSLIDVMEIRDGNGRLAGYFLPDVYDLSGYPEFTLTPARITRLQVRTQCFDVKMPLNALKDKYGQIRLSLEAMDAGAELENCFGALSGTNSKTVTFTTNENGPNVFYNTRNGTFYNYEVNGQVHSLRAPPGAEGKWRSANKTETITLQFDDRTHECINDRRFEFHHIGQNVQRILYKRP